METDIVENYNNFIAELKQKCQDCNRNYNDITLVGVSKTKPREYIEKLTKLGLSEIGENYVSEISSKFSKTEEENRRYKLRMIGHLQTNKVKTVIEYVDSIDSIDSFHLASKVYNSLYEIDKKIEVLFEISSCDDPNKTGFKSMDEIRRTLDFVLKGRKYMDFKGFMTIGALSDDQAEIRKSFSKFLSIIRTLENEYPELRGAVKSFGMTSDWKIALEMGSNMIRIGRAIFGER